MVDENLLYNIELGDNKNLQFVLRNSSNGYYSGYLDIEFLKDRHIEKMPL